MTTNVVSNNPMQSADSRTRSQSAHQSPAQNGKKINAEALIHRDGRVKLEYTEKFQTEINELISRYLKPSREILSRPKVSLADKKLQKYLRILQTIQQRLVKVISEVKNDDSIVNLAIKANDSIVATVQWFNSLVKRSKSAKNRNQPFNADKSVLVKKEVLENVDLVGLEQQLFMDGADLFKRKQMRELKLQKEQQLKEEQARAAAAAAASQMSDDGKDAVNSNVSQEIQSPPNEPVAVDAVQVDLVSGDPVAAQMAVSAADSEPEEKSFDRPIQAQANGNESARFNAAVNAYHSPPQVLQPEPQQIQPVQPQVVEADFKEMNDDMGNGGKDDDGNEVVDLLNMNTMEDGGKVEVDKGNEVNQIMQGMEQVDMGQTAADDNNDDDVVADMTTTLQGDEVQESVSVEQQ